LPLRFIVGSERPGFVEGRNLVIEYRWAESKYERRPAFAADLVRLNVAAIHVSNTIAARAAKDAAVTIPIVFGVAADPVAMGFVASLNRPGAGATATRSRRAHIDQGLSVPVIQHHADNDAGHSHTIIIPSPKIIAELS
jgi:putative ABC transport system substrate-binding protein